MTGPGSNVRSTDLQSELLPTVPCGYVLMKLQLNKFNGQIGKK